MKFTLCDCTTTGFNFSPVFLISTLLSYFIFAKINGHHCHCHYYYHHYDTQEGAASLSKRVVESSLPVWRHVIRSVSLSFWPLLSFFNGVIWISYSKRSLVATWRHTGSDESITNQYRSHPLPPDHNISADGGLTQTQFINISGIHM